MNGVPPVKRRCVEEGGPQAADERAPLLQPPVAVRRPYTVLFGKVPGSDQLRGTDENKLMDPPLKHQDDLYWLRDDERKNEEVIAHLEAENAYTEQETRPFAKEVDTLYAEFRSRMKETDVEVPYRRGAFMRYSRTQEGKAYPIHCRSACEGKEEEEIILDENEVASGHEMCDVRELELSPDVSQALLAYSVDFSGLEIFEIRFKTLRNSSGGYIYSEVLRGTAGQMAWGKDDAKELFYLSLDNEHRPHRLWRHVLGTPQIEDECLFEEKDERFWLSLKRELSGDFVTLSSTSKLSSEVWVIPLSAAAEAAVVKAGASSAVALQITLTPASSNEDDDDDDDDDSGDEKVTRKKAIELEAQAIPSKQAGKHRTDVSTGSEIKGAAVGSRAKETPLFGEACIRVSATTEAATLPSRPPMPMLQLLQARADNVLYSACFFRPLPRSDPFGTWLILTNADGAQNFKVIACPPDRPERKNWRDVVTHDSGRYITGVTAFAHFWVVEGREDGYENVWVAPPAEIQKAVTSALVAFSSDGTTQPLRLSRLPAREPVYVLSLDGVKGNEEYEEKALRFSYSSPTCPVMTCSYRLVATEAARMGAADEEAKDVLPPCWPAPSVTEKATTITILKQQEVPSCDPSLYASARLWATNPDDGTRIPISLVYRRPSAHETSSSPSFSFSSLSSSSSSSEACPFASPVPLYLYGYGAYGLSEDPFFSFTALSLCDRGLVFAIAHVRGGGEMGRGWYEPPKGGKLQCKWNTFRDYIACADYLIAAGWTSKGLICASGGSAGGLLMGVVTNERPDLFGAVLAEVAFLDALVTMADSSLPLVSTEWDEWGNPNEKGGYDMLRSYSPMDNVKAQQYPPMLLEAGLYDSRVGYFEPTKFVQRVRDKATEGSGAGILLRIKMKEGHTGAMDRYAYLKEKAAGWAWFLQHLSVRSGSMGSNIGAILQPPRDRDDGSDNLRLS